MVFNSTDKSTYKDCPISSRQHEQQNGERSIKEIQILTWYEL